MTEKEYRKHPAINYSLLSNVAYDPLKVLAESESSDAFTFGSAVDCILTRGYDAFNEEYVTLEKRTDIIGEIVDAVYDKVKDFGKNLADHKDLIEHNIDALNYQPRWKPETRVNKIIDEGSLYFESLRLAGDKTILSSLEFHMINKVVSDLENSPYLTWLFKPAEGMEVLKQVVIIWNHDGHECKSLLDFIHIDHNAKIITPVDLKTTGKPVGEFANAFVYWRYYLQAAFYQEAIISWGMENYPDYEIDNFKFVVAEKACNHAPLCFEVSNKQLVVGKHGGTLNGKTVKGYDDLIKDLVWHRENGVWNITRDNCYDLEMDRYITLDVECTVKGVTV